MDRDAYSGATRRRLNLRHQGTNLSRQIRHMSQAPVAWGGFSVIYKAVLDSRPVAVKMIKGVADDETSKRKFRRESVLWSQLIHANIATCLGFAEGPRMGPFGAMISSWCENGDAESYLARNGSSLDCSARMDLWMGVASGVSYLHEHSPTIIHGDLKPKNVLIDSQRCPKLCDFGLARLVTDGARTGLTTTTEYMGTARYVAPDLLGEFATLPTKATDIWALGCIGLEFVYSILPYRHRINNMRGCIIRDIKKGRLPAQRESIPESDDYLWSLLVSCWGWEPLSRPSCRDLLLIALAIKSDTRMIVQHVETPLKDIQMAEELPAWHASQSIRNSLPDLTGAAQHAWVTHPINEESILSIFEQAKEYQSEAQHALAIDLFVEVLEWRRINLGEDNEDTVDTVDWLAWSYESLGRYAEAIELQLKTTEWLRANFGEDHEQTVDAMEFLAWLYHSSSQYAEAADLRVKVLAWQRTNLGEDNEDTIDTTDWLALSYEHLGRCNEALDLLIKVLGHRRVMLGEDHGQVIDTMVILARLYHSLNRYKEAADLRVKVLTWRRENLGEDHQDTIDAMNWLAFSYNFLDRDAEAVELRVKVLAWRRTNLAKDNEDTIDAINWLALSYESLRRYTEAADLLVELLAHRRARLGENHQQTIDTMSVLARLYHPLSRYTEAADLHLRVLAWRKENLGDDHKDTIDATSWLALSYNFLSREDKAVDLLSRVLRWRRTNLGEDDEGTFQAMGWLADSLGALGRYTEATELWFKIDEFKKTR